MVHDIALEISTIFVVILFVFLTISANGLMLDISKGASLNVTYSLYELDGDRINYCVQVKNEGLFLFKDVAVTNNLPPGLAYKPENQDYNSIILLRCIENNENGTIKNLTWYLGSIDTGQYKWLNFTVEQLHANGNLSHHRIIWEGMALGYPVMGVSPLEAEPYSKPQTVEVMVNYAEEEVASQTNFTIDEKLANLVPENALNDVMLSISTSDDNISAEVA